VGQNAHPKLYLKWTKGHQTVILVTFFQQTREESQLIA